MRVFTKKQKKKQKVTFEQIDEGSKVVNLEQRTPSRGTQTQGP